MESVLLRRASNGDADAVRALVFGVLHSYGLRPDPATTDRDLDNLEAHYFSNNGWFGVLEGPGGIIGSYGLMRQTSETCELRKMYLDPGFRGRGLGKLLLEDAMARARGLGYAVIVLETASVLMEAVALYESYGFEPYMAEHLSERCDQAYRKDLQRTGISTNTKPVPRILE